MTEVPQNIPFEEQARQDLRFEEILRVCPDLMEKLILLLNEQADDPENIHSKFWLLYLERVNAIHIKMAEGLENPSSHDSIFGARINTEVIPAIEGTDRASFQDPELEEYREVVEGLPIDDSLVESAVFFRDVPKWILGRV